MTREAAIREANAWPTDNPDVAWLLAELVAARERADHLEEVMLEAEEKARERERTLREALDEIAAKPYRAEEVIARLAALDAAGGQE